MKKSVLAALLLIGSLGAALAQGAFPNYPTVGVPADTECLSYGNNSVCNQYRPAGPTAITGNETVPADTNLANGANPQTVRIDITSLGAGPYQYAAPATGETLTLTAAQRRLIINPSTTLAALTVAFPAATALKDNQLMGLCSTQIVTTLTLTAGAGSTILNGPTALAVPPATGAGTCYEWVYRVTNTSWYRVQ